jgi:hypothetical protein
MVSIGGDAPQVAVLAAFLLGHSKLRNGLRRAWFCGHEAGSLAGTIGRNGQHDAYHEQQRRLRVRWTTASRPP